jgi:hypothetical protein
MRWAEHVARMGEEIKVYKILMGKTEGMRPLGRPRSRCGKMGSEWLLGRLAWGCGLDSTGSGQGPVAGCCECGDEPSGSCVTELVNCPHCPLGKALLLAIFPLLSSLSLRPKHNFTFNN